MELAKYEVQLFIDSVKDSKKANDLRFKLAFDYEQALKDLENSLEIPNETAKEKVSKLKEEIFSKILPVNFLYFRRVLKIVRLKASVLPEPVQESLSRKWRRFGIREKKTFLCIIRDVCKKIIFVKK